MKGFGFNCGNDEMAKKKTTAKKTAKKKTTKKCAKKSARKTPGVKSNPRVKSKSKSDAKPESDRVLRDRALSKIEEGVQPTPEEEAARRRLGPMDEDERRFGYYRSVPKKHLVAMSGRQHKVLDDYARNYGIPTNGKVVDMEKVFVWLYDFLAKNGRKLRTPEHGKGKGEEGDEGTTEVSPGLERGRMAKARISELDLELRIGQLVELSDMQEVFGIIATILTGAGETLQRKHGAEAGKILDQALVQILRAAEELLTP